MQASIPKGCGIRALAIVTAALLVALTNVSGMAAQPPTPGQAAPAGGNHAGSAAGTGTTPTQAAEARPTCPVQPEMSFIPWTNPLGQAFGQGDREYIFADGYICSDTAQKFKQFLAKHPPKPNTTVVLNSGGGNLGIGMQLGRIIRQNKMWTEVGSFVPVVIPNGSTIEPQMIPYISEPIAPPFPGACYSACNFVFMGGVRRTISPLSNFGVHQFKSTLGASNSDLESQTERSTAAIVAFLKEMGISSDWIMYMVEKRGNEVTNLNMLQMRDLDVITPRWRTKWQIEPLAHKSGFALVGTTTDNWGTQIVTLTCASSVAPASAQPGQAGAAAQSAQRPALIATFALDPGARGSAASVVNDVAGYSVAFNGDVDPAVLMAKQLPPARVVDNRLVFSVPLAAGTVANIAKRDRSVVAVIFNPAAKLRMQLLTSHASVNGPLVKQFAATCH